MIFANEKELINPELYYKNQLVGKVNSNSLKYYDNYGFFTFTINLLKDYEKLPIEDLTLVIKELDMKTKIIK